MLSNNYRSGLRPRFSVFFLTTGLFFLFQSCGAGKLGYGVILWSENEALLTTGSIVQVIEESNLNKAYTIVLPRNGKKLSVPMWRMLLKKSKKEAERYIKENEEYLNFIGIAEVSGLSVRENPASEARRIYKLRKNEKIKVLAKLPEPAKEGNFEGFWYKVLTEDGTTGYCFSYALNIVALDKKQIETVISETDAAIENLLTRIWWPEYFQQMIQTRRVNLQRFSAGYGLFPEKSKNTIKLITEKNSVTFTYSDIIAAGSNQYLFQDADLQIKILSENLIQAEFTEGGKKITEKFVYLPEQDINTIIENEKIRREEQYQQFLGKGTVFSSSAYGIIAFEQDGSFTWEHFDRLIPNIIPRTAGGKGSVEFNLFLGDDLKVRYEGVISFHFSNTGDNVYTNFIYTFVENGLKFIYVPESDIKEGIVERQNPSPIVLFFIIQG
ncbi:MAG: SH3 domain-containing protein [Spirochaetota bacterium]